MKTFLRGERLLRLRLGSPQEFTTVETSVVLPSIQVPVNVDESGWKATIIVAGDLHRDILEAIASRVTFRP